MQSTIESRSGELMSIPLSRLVASGRNARTTGDQAVADLAASIRAVGILHNLIVCPVHDKKGRATGDYEVVGGRRRLRALQALAREGDIAADEPILCRVKPTRDAAEASLAENVVREAMHPGDEFVAFKRLVDEGRSVEDVALRFGVSPLTVRRRLKLAALHPALIELYRTDGITIEQLMALAVGDDPNEQWRAWEAAPEWQRDPASLKRALLAHEMDAKREPLVKLVGLAAYEAAGGRVRRDLFDDEEGGYVQDGALLRQLASERLEAAAEAVRAEGWAWVDVVPELGASELFRFDRCRKTRRAMSKAEAKRHAVLAQRVMELDAALERHYDGDEVLSEEAVGRLEQEAEEAREALGRFEAALESYSQESLARCGAIVSVSRAGEIEVHRGLMRGAARDGARRDPSAEQEGCGEEGVKPSSRPLHSAALMLDLTAHRTLAARAAMLEQPRVALVVLLHALVQRLVYDGRSPAQTAVRLVPNAPDADLVGKASEEVRNRRAALAVAQARSQWLERLPAEPDALLEWLLTQDRAELEGLLALCVALTLNDVRDVERVTPMDAVAAALSLDMAQWWEPTAQGYFSRVTKEAILAGIAEGAGDEAARRIKGVSKADLARVAERELQGRRWLPGPLRGPGARHRCSDRLRQHHGHNSRRLSLP